VTHETTDTQSPGARGINRAAVARNAVHMRVRRIVLHRRRSLFGVHRRRGKTRAGISPGAHYVAPARMEWRNAMSGTGTPPRLGLLCGILRNAAHAGADTSNGGVSARVTRVMLVGKGLPQLVVASPDCPAVELIEDRNGYRYAVPCDLLAAGVWTMFGGAFVWTSDSRFPNAYPIPLHDRVEASR
jgi:hypothetical protein